MPRTLLLPIPHEIADKVHHALLAAANADADLLLSQETPPSPDTTKTNKLYALADTLDTLARESGVIGW
jgi:hypothetical protein